MVSQSKSQLSVAYKRKSVYLIVFSDFQPPAMFKENEVHLTNSESSHIDSNQGVIFMIMSKHAGYEADLRRTASSKEKSQSRRWETANANRYRLELEFAKAGIWLKEIRQRKQKLKNIWETIYPMDGKCCTRNA